MSLELIRWIANQLRVALLEEEESGAVTLHFSIANWSVPPGWIRVTTFNEVGESDLSDEAVFL